MRNHVRHSRGERTQPAFEEGHERGTPAASASRDRRVSGLRPAREGAALSQVTGPADGSWAFGGRGAFGAFGTGVPEGFDDDGEAELDHSAGFPGFDGADGFDGDDIEDAEDAGTAEGFDDDADLLRVTCPDCGRPITVLGDGDLLPQHALCPTPWDPFGLTVCAGSGRAVAEALPQVADVTATARREGADFGTLLTLPAGLDWRTQPFSHVGGPGSRPMRLPAQPVRTPHLAA